MLLYGAIIIILFVIVIWNNKRNKEKLYNRKGRNFRENYKLKKKEIIGEDTNSKNQNSDPITKE